MSASPDIFLSYSREDRSTARRFAEAFAAEGFSVWWDVTLRSGDDYDEVTEKALREAKAVIVLWSKQSVASRWVRSEATIAQQNRTLMPVMIEACQRPIMFELTHTTDLSHWKGDVHDNAWQDYVADIRRFLGTPGPDTTATPASSPSRHPAAKPSQFLSRRNVAIISLLILAVAALLFLYLRPPAGQVAANAHAPRTAIAVMPFANLTGDASKDYLGDGLAEQLIDTLAKVPGMQVQARTSTFAYKGRNTDIREIGKELNVDAVLEGSVRAADKRIRVTAQLINAQDGLHIWSETYDEEFTDIFKLQDKLAAQIAKALVPNLSGSAQAALAQAPPTQDAEAYRLYLQGMALIDRGLQKEPAVHAIEVFTQAIARDPKFARAYRGLAIAHINLAHAGDETIHAEQEAEGMKALAQAVALDPSLGLDATFSKASSLPPIAAEAAYRAALVSQPDEPQVHFAYALHLAELGHFREAFGQIGTALSLQQTNAQVAAMSANYLLMIGEEETAQQMADLAVKLGWRKDFGPLMGVGVRQALIQHRLDDLDRFLKLVDPKGLADPEYVRLRAALQRLYVLAADPAQRATAIALRSELYPRRSLTLVTTAPCMGGYQRYAEMGALDAAFELANRCRDEAPAVLQSSMIINAYTKRMRMFRQDPRFQAFALRFGDAMPYWKDYGPPDDCTLANGKLTCH